MIPFLIAAAVGVGTGVHGAKKMKDANDTMKAADYRHKRNIEKFEETSKVTNKAMDTLGELELNILHGFDEFSDTIERIQNRPQFKEINISGVELPKYDKQELKQVSVGAGVLLGGIGGAAAGTVGGFAAAGATTSAVMAFGTASTGTAIASLSGAAATNATLAALGGGSIATGGGGIVAGMQVLNAATLGVGLIVGGVIFNVAGGKLSDKADEAWRQMKKAEETIDNICEYLNDLESSAIDYKKSIDMVYKKYKLNYKYLSEAVNVNGKYDWNDFTTVEKKATQNTVLLVGLLFKMCQVSLVEKGEEEEINSVNHEAIEESINNAEVVTKSLGK